MKINTAKTCMNEPSMFTYMFYILHDYIYNNTVRMINIMFATRPYPPTHYYDMCLLSHRFDFNRFPTRPS